MKKSCEQFEQSPTAQVIFGTAVAASSVRGLHPTQPFPELTDRERQILALVAEGYDNPTIGSRLSISPKTAANHVPRY